MRYLFSFVIISVCWITTVLIASSKNVETIDRFGLYLCMIVLTMGIYVIGFSKK